MNVHTLRPSASICVFAHNEELGIETCLNSLYLGGLEDEFQIHVLANGCSDRTEEVVARYALSHPGITLHRMALGDKTNAWNTYIHEIAGPAAVHLFVDGDVSVVLGSLAVLAAALDNDPAANGSTALPGSGRNSGNWLSLIVDNHGIAGNLYALRGAFVDRIRAADIRLPVGLIGDDSWVGAITVFDLDVARGWVKERVVVCPEARFRFDSLQWYRPRDVRLYWRRRVRYAHRSWQNLCMKKHLHERGISTLPKLVTDLYREYPELLHMRWSGVDTLFMWLARRKILAGLAA